MAMCDPVNVIKGDLPDNFHCRCDYCREYIGELRPADGSYYSRLERRQYYDPIETGGGGKGREAAKERTAHLAKTPVHIARWAVQAYTEPGDFVLDPTIGAGTTAVESLTQGRSIAGMELQYSEVLKANVSKHLKEPLRADIRIGDARRIGAYLDELGHEFSLIVNNPPYSGDESMPSPAKEGRGKENRDKETFYFYKDGLPNLAFLKEKQEYWDALTMIYSDCVKHLKPGGHFVTGVKDLMRGKKPFLLHKMICDMMTERVGLKFVGTALLKHHPTTMFLNTYFKQYKIHPPYYQTIDVFRKE